MFKKVKIKTISCCDQPRVIDNKNWLVHRSGSLLNYYNIVYIGVNILYRYVVKVIKITVKMYTRKHFFHNGLRVETLTRKL